LSRAPSAGLPGFLPPDPRVEEPYRVTPQLALRIAILGILAITIFCALFFRLWALQVISGERYLEDAKNNQIRSFRLQAPRGSIVDRNGSMLVSNTPGTVVQIWPAALEDIPSDTRVRMLKRLSRLLGLRQKDVRREVHAGGESDPLTPVLVDTNVGDRKAAYLMEHQAEFPGVQISEAYRRRYDHGAIASQILGYVGEISQKQLKTRAQEGYAAGDIIGQTGIEAIYDGFLRGAPGVGRVFVDALGRVTSERQFSQLPEAGDTVRLTIDAELQRVAEEALEYGIRLAHDDGEWAADGGALIAMDIHTGEILALASNPTYDPGIWVERDAKKIKALGDPSANSPTLNRAVSGLFPPGSTFKPITALAALQEGMLTPDELIQCTGKRVIDKQTFMNWDPYKNVPMNLTVALANSCDTYFYEVALRFYAGHAPWGSGTRPVSTSAPRRAGSCRLRPGNVDTSRPKSTRSGRAETRSSSPSDRATCS
jgi:penicillin-binding protein 2